MEIIQRLDFYSILLFMSMGQLFLSMLYLISKPNKDSSAIFLILVLFIFSLNIVEPVFIKTHFLSSVPHLLYIGPFFLLLLGPAMYFQTIAIKEVKFKWRTVYFLHILPFVLDKLWRFPNFLQSASEKRKIIDRFYEFKLSDEYLYPNIDIVSLLFQLHPVIYLFISITILLKDIKTPQTRFHRNHTVYIIGFTSVVCFYLFGNWLFYSLQPFPNEMYWQVLSILFFILASYISYAVINNLLKPRKQKRNLRLNSKMIDMHAQIKELMLKNKPYLNEDISLDKIARQMNMSSKVFSKIINEFEQQNFSDFINSYRIADAKELIIDPKMEQYTIEAIAHEVGFSNKMSFNRAFKKYLNMTPSEYKSINK
ncbi:helix-turn-helix domain-containing protein [Pontimicrobium aquaticum]|nr:AraC family transcriptional regulator [Pontimicrobium aquaticum]